MASANGRALLVEDEFLVALGIAELIEQAGFAVIGPAARVEQALALADAQPELAFAVLDVNLAGEKSWPVARRLGGRGVPFLFVSGYLPSHAGLPPDLAGATVLSKPLEPRVFLRTLARLA